MAIPPGTKFDSIASYHAAFPPEVQAQLRAMQDAIQQAAPEATPVISYNMPAFRLSRVLVYYAAHKHHIGFYPTSSGIAAFADLLKPYKTSRGAVQFPIDQPLPLELIRQMVWFRLQEENDRKKPAGRRR